MLCVNLTWVHSKYQLPTQVQSVQKSEILADSLAYGAKEGFLINQDAKRSTNLMRADL